MTMLTFTILERLFERYDSIQSCQRCNNNPNCPIDSLDHATYKPNLGGKWPDVVETDVDIRRKIDAIWDELRRLVF